MKKHRRSEYLPGWFEYVSALGASLLVDATERLFRDYKEKQKRHPLSVGETPLQSAKAESDDDTDSDLECCSSGTIGPINASNRKKILPGVKETRVQPLLSLEYLVSSLTIFETTVPHDTIYALLASAKDTTPRAIRIDETLSSDQARAGLKVFMQRKQYRVDYQLPYVDVCQQFVQFSIERSLHIDRSRALDVICRPWATEERFLKRERAKKAKKEAEQEDVARSRQGKNNSANTGKVEEVRVSSNQIGQKSQLSSEYEEHDLGAEHSDMPLPSWIPQLSNAPYGMSPRPGFTGPKMSRKNADPLVGLPSLTHKIYCAAETKGVDMKSLKFRKRADFQHYSMFVRGFCLDEIQDIEQVARNGQIPREWAELGGWTDAEGAPPDAFWRTLVADRGRDGKNPPVYYSRACKESFNKGGFESGAVDTTALINYERNSVVAHFCRRVQAVIWNRALIKTKGGRLGLVGKRVNVEDKVCIIYGCSVPVILRKSSRKSDKDLEEKMIWELGCVSKLIGQNFRHYRKRMDELMKRKRKEILPIYQQWAKSTNWLRYHGAQRNDSYKRFVVDEKGYFADIVKRALENFNQWYSDRRQMRATKEWEEIEERKRVEEAYKQRTELETSVRRKRWSRQSFAHTDFLNVGQIEESISKETETTCDQQDTASKSRSQRFVQSPAIDWWEFDRQLRFGRKWKKAVKDRKAKLEQEMKRRMTEIYLERQRKWLKHTRGATSEMPVNPPRSTNSHSEESSETSQTAVSDVDMPSVDAMGEHRVGLANDLTEEQEPFEMKGDNEAGTRWLISWS